MEDNGECMLALIDATPEAKRNPLASRLGCASAQGWRETLTDIKQRGLEIARTSRLATAHSASEKQSRLSPTTRH